MTPRVSGLRRSIPRRTPGLSITVPVDVPAGLDEDAAPRPGSAGEHSLQQLYGTAERADRFYDDQLRDRLLPRMVEFVGRMEMVFVSTADAHGECDVSLRAGPPGFIVVLDEFTLAYPEYRGNGVLASLGNISENAHVGLLMVDFVGDLIGLHVNGTARIVDDEEFHRAYDRAAVDHGRGRAAERWVVVSVEETYIHCRKHIPRMERVSQRRAWGTDDAARKGGDYFRAKGTLQRVPRELHAAAAGRRRRFPSTTHLIGGVSRTLRKR